LALEAFNEEGSMAYADCLVVPVPKKNIEKYRELAKLSAKVWREHGALEYKEWLADDVKPGEVTSFPQSVKLQDGETITFTYILYKSRAQRDEVMAKVMADPRMKGMDPASFPFDGKRMFFGGFEEFVGA
jgi:uncharacterized protein YbaA (DUF1428 family)